MIKKFIKSITRTLTKDFFTIKSLDEQEKRNFQFSINFLCLILIFLFSYFVLIK